MNKDIQDISEGAMKVLLEYEWPGNVRELENAIERAIVTCRGQLLTEDDFGFLMRTMQERKAWSVPANMTLQDLERQAVQAALQRTGGNVKEAASSLGIDRSTMYEKIKIRDPALAPRREQSRDRE